MTHRVLRMDMDFTFPAATSTTAAAAATATTPTPEPPAVVIAGALPAAAACRQLPSSRFAAASSSPPPWFPSSPSPTAATGAPPVTTSRAPTAMAAQQGPPGAGGGDAAAADAEVEEDRMDLLWEDFNEELARGGSCRAGGGLQQARELWSSDLSDDAESSEPAAVRGCAPVLRPSSRAAGTVRHCRRRAGTWVLLMRIFRRLFVIEKTAVSAAAAAATTRAS